MAKSKVARTAYALVEVPGGWGVAACVQGEKGYHPVPDYGPYKEESRAQGVVDRLNARLGCSRAQARLIVHSTMRA